MSECIGPNGWLSDRVVLMATNALERLQGVPRIALLSNGELLEEGSFEQLSQQSDGAFAKLLDLQRRQHAHEDDENAGSEEAALRRRLPTLRRHLLRRPRLLLAL